MTEIINKGTDNSVPLNKLDEFYSFTDVTIFINNLAVSIFSYKSKNGFSYLPKDPEIIESFKIFIKRIISIGDKQKRKDVIVLFNDRYFRCCIYSSVVGTTIAVRQLPLNFLDLTSLKIPNRLIKELLHERLNDGGLLFICGSPGNGKTTTSSALIKKRLELFGGMCMTVEDPPEIPIHGKHGKGYCVQTQTEDEDFAKSMKTSLRCFPTGSNNIMFVGEIREDKDVVEVLKAAIDGRLVITTFHAESVCYGLQKMATMAARVIGDEAYDLLSAAFKIGLHQKIKRNGDKLRVNFECMVNTTALTNIVKKKGFSYLRNEAETQSTKLKQNKEIEYHNHKKTS